MFQPKKNIAPQHMQNNALLPNFISTRFPYQESIAKQDEKYKPTTHKHFA
jgi:hypothetical protein